MHNFLGKPGIALVLALMLPIFSYRALAAESVPYSCGFSETEFATWSLQDLDGDGINWYFGTSSYGGDGAASGYSSDNDVNNVMVSPAIYLEAGEKYTLTFTAYTSYYERENLEVGIGTSTDISTHTILFTQEIKNYYGQKCEIELPQIEADGDYYLSFRHYLSQSKGMIIVIKDLKLDAPAQGSLKGTVALEGSDDCTGVNVFIKELPELFSATTAADGSFEFSKVPVGNYTLEAEYHGYFTGSQAVTVANGETTPVSLTLAQMQKGTLSGTISHTDGTPVRGAAVTITGYDDYTAVTDDEGKFSVSGVTINDNTNSEYAISVSKNLLADVQLVANLSEAQPVKEVVATLAQIGVKPFAITSDGLGNVTWTRPVHLREHSYDTGEYDDVFGYSTGSEYNVVGNLFFSPMTLYKFKYYSAEIEGAASSLIIYVLEVGSNGEPTGKVLYSTIEPNFLNKWVEISLPEPIKCEYGCAIAIAGDGPVSIARDNNPEILPGKKSFFSSYYSAPDAYCYFSDMDYTGALLIRVDGENIEDSLEENYEYLVTRYNIEDSSNPEAWVSFPATTATSLTDSDWTSLKQGYYVYSVKAHYTIDDVTSEATNSDNVAKDMSCNLTLQLGTNSGNAADADGALFEVYRQGMKARTATVESGSATIEGLLKGEYSYRITRKGFSPIEGSIVLEDNAQTIQAELRQLILPIANIDYIAETNTLAWDFFADITEDFDGEDFSDFEINAPGELGWNYYDGDMYLTYGFSGISFPGMGSKMAAIVFNGKNTAPAMPQETAHSGDRALAFFDAAATLSSEETSGEPDKHQTDDWFISPELDYHRDFKFSFWARSYMYVEDALETIRVGYSTTGMAPEDFTFVSGLMEAPVDYKRFEFTIPKEAKYVAINNYTFDGFFLLVDDVEMTTGIKHSGEGPCYGSFVGYRVTIDGQSTELPNDVTTLSLSDLDEGEHTASIVKLYATAESTPLTLTFNVTAGIVTINSDATAPAVYYNLQGIKVDEPHNGVFIRRQGNTFQKVYIK